MPGCDIWVRELAIDDLVMVLVVGNADRHAVVCSEERRACEPPRLSDEPAENGLFVACEGKRGDRKHPRIIQAEDVVELAPDKVAGLRRLDLP